MESFIGDWLQTDKLDRHDLTTFVIDALVAGRDTTSYTTAILLYNLTTIFP